MMATRPLKPLVLAPASTPASFTLADAEAMHMLAVGTAEPDQQKRALKWIIEQAAATYQWAYRDNQRETDVALGRAFVGQQIVGLTKIDLATLRRQANAT